MLFALGEFISASDATHMVQVRLVITEQVGTVEHRDPRVVRVVLKGCGGPIG